MRNPGLLSVFVVMFAVGWLSCAGTSAGTKPDAPAGKAPVRFIFDTDMDTDVDDIGSVAVLHALADAGEIDILATVSSSFLPESSLCLNAMNTYFGRPRLPVGQPKGEGAGISRGTKYADIISNEYPHALTADAIPDAVDVYRKVLAEAPDNSVVIATVGYVTNLRDLLKSSPDEHSPLNGHDLVVKKVKEVSCMGGRIPRDKGSSESGNFRPDPDSTKYFFENWPTQVMFSGDEIGERIMTGERVRKELPENHPTRRAYDAYLGEKPERPSWDQAAVLYGARGLGHYWTAHHQGHNAIIEHGNNEWRNEPDNKNHSYLVEKMDPEKVADIIEDLMVRAGQK